jgi:hypothetical protein
MARPTRYAGIRGYPPTMELQMTETLALIAALASAVAVAASFLTATERRNEPVLQPVPVPAERDPVPRRGASHRED